MSCHSEGVFKRRPAKDVHLEVTFSGDPGVKYKMVLIKTLEMYCNPQV